MASIPPNVSCMPPNLTKTLKPLTPSFSFSPTSSFSLRPFIKHSVCTNLTCSLSDQFYHDPVRGYPRPSEIQWKKELCNSVQLIGIVALPIQINQLSSDKVVASTCLAVRKSAIATTWINLTFWDELAHTAYQHLEKGHQIYVSGRLVSDTVEGENGKNQTYYKVVVHQLNFVGRNSPSPVPLYDGNFTSMQSVGNFNDSGAMRSSTQELWQAFFANPVEWWDNRKNKKNPKYPDFKHKDTGEALWVEGRNNPPWVKSQLEILDSRIHSLETQDDSGVSRFLNGVY